MLMHITIALDIVKRPLSVWTMRQIRQQEQMKRKTARKYRWTVARETGKERALEPKYKEHHNLKRLDSRCHFYPSNSSKYFLGAPFTFLLSFFLHSNSYRIPIFTLQLLSCWKNTLVAKRSDAMSKIMSAYRNSGKHNWYFTGSN